MSKILITGASGYLGGRLCHHLTAAGYQVAALVRPNSNLKKLQGLNIQLIELAEYHELAAKVSQLNLGGVIHTACSYGRKGESVQEVVEANYLLGVALLQGCISAGKPVVFLNTGTVLQSSVGIYAITKNQFSELGMQLCAGSQAPKVQFIDIALQHMFGPGDDASKFTTYVIRSCLANIHSLPLTEGTQRRDFIYIDDVVQGYSTLLDQAGSLNKTERVELGSSHAPTLREFVEMVHQLSNSKTKLEFGAVPMRAGDAPICVANTQRMQQLGWSARYSLQEGITKTIQMENKA
ncbi:NAD-dependent epimerase/dehydratase family protein [Limnobacter sp.]|uniref:NAD-dependent epimerase/dehydratase family protein n=1 Tax=Limnobacter sp. TaxID=2003368 RepID=UPI003BABE02B